MGKKIILKGALTERSVDGQAWTTIRGCKSLVIPTVETEFLDSTDLDSEGDWNEYERGMNDAGVLTVECNYDPDEATAQYADAALDEPVYYRTTLRAARNQATGDVFEFQAWPTPQPVGNGLGQLVGLNVALRTTGPMTRTAGTAAAGS